MRKRITLLAMVGFALLTVPGRSQTSAGLFTGSILDPTGAALPGAIVTATNQGTGAVRTAVSGDNGIYLVPDVEPGLYTITAKKEGFTIENRPNVRLEINQSITLDFHLSVSATQQVVNVNAEPPQLNTTSSTISNVINHDATVDLPLNGRHFTQLALLVPGAAAHENSQQSSFTVSLGQGGISPSVDGQRGYQNNFTMDGTLNNAPYLNTWAIAPPPDAIQEFDVQVHITDAQYAISSGANINLESRRGTNAYHGSLWEFLRNSALDAQTYPATSRLEYHQNQYGLFMGGPFWIPHVVDTRDKTWFSLYWEGFRSIKAGTSTATVLTQNMINGIFTGVAHIYNPATTAPAPTPSSPNAVKRTEFTNDVIPPQDINPAAQAILAAYYPIGQTSTLFPFVANTDINSDVLGGRLDHQLTAKDYVFARFNRANVHEYSPATLPTYSTTTRNYAEVGAFGYTRTFNPTFLLNFRVGYTYANDYQQQTPMGPALTTEINSLAALPPQEGQYFGPSIQFTNGYSNFTQSPVRLGPQELMDWHLDAQKIKGHHTLGAGLMFIHIRDLNNSWHANVQFTVNGTSLDGTSAASSGGYSPASFLLGVVDSYAPFVGNTQGDQTDNWYGIYAQDQWQVNPRLVLQAGIRWDYVTPPNFHKIVSSLDLLTGVFGITGAVPPYFPKATASPGYFNPQYDGWEPRFGATVKVTDKLVWHNAFAMLDDHNNTLIQENQNIRVSWPSSYAASSTQLDVATPKVYLNALTPASTYLNVLTPYASYATNPNNKIPYSMEYNAGIQYQLTGTLSARLDYVGSVSRHQYIVPQGDTAPTPGPGSLQLRQPYPQYGGTTIPYAWNVSPASYNALQLHVEKRAAQGLFLLGSYTWSKSMDYSSEPYSVTEEDFYNLHREWAPSDYSFKHMLVISGVYELPFGRGMRYMTNANTLAQGFLGGWRFGAIFSAHSGQPFDVLAGSDIANVGQAAGVERAQRTGGNPYAPNRGPQQWLNKAVFSVPAVYTFGNEARNDITGPGYRDVDVNLSKGFPLFRESVLEARFEFFNVFNTDNFVNPVSTVTSATFGQITGQSYPGREGQAALKIIF